MASSEVDYVVSKDHIIHSLMMAFLVYLAAVRFADATGASVRLKRSLYGGIVALSLYNLLGMLRGRTGYVLLASLTLLFFVERMGKRGAAFAAVLLGVAAYGGISCSEMISDRVGQTILQLENQFGPERKHSPDPRMEFLANTVELIRGSGECFRSGPN